MKQWELLSEYNVSSLNEFLEKVNAPEIAVKLERKANAIYRSKEEETLKKLFKR